MKQCHNKHSMDNLSYSPSSSEYLDADDELRRSTYLTPCQSQQGFGTPVSVCIPPTAEEEDDQSPDLRGSKLTLQGSECETETRNVTSLSQQVEDDDQMTVSETSVAMEMVLKQSRIREIEPLRSASEMGCSSVDEQDVVDEKILETLREVVRKCTNSNPSKRPNAIELLTLMQNCIEECEAEC